MGKTVAGILETVVGIGLEFTPFAAVGTSLILTGVGTIIAAATATHQPPDTTETAVKLPIPARVSAYGFARRQGAYIL